MPRFDNVLDEPEDRKPSKTDTKKANPFSHLDDLDSFDLTGKGLTRANPTADEPKKSSNSTPNMPKASAASTREKTSRITPGDQMRDYLGRINFNQDDEISDAEARLRAGQPQDNETLPTRVTRQNMPAILSSNVIAAGMQNPEWHTINNLPGYMARQIRAMGRQFFRMFTNTPLEDIMTIANVQGQGPNSDAELRAVGAWLMQNGEDLGDVEVDMGQAIPGYRPEVKEYRAAGIRFHVVRDPMGQYIYAYPDQDSVRQSDNDRLSAPRRPGLPHRRESIMNNKNAIFEGIFNSDLEKLQLVEEKLSKKWTQELIESILVESTLSRLIGDSPGGQNIVRWLHNHDNLDNNAEWDEHPVSVPKLNRKGEPTIDPETGKPATKPADQRIQWQMFKDSPDHFIVVSGTRGVVAIKPDKSYIDQKRSKNPDYRSGPDNGVPYQVVAFQRDQRVDNLLIPDEADPQRKKKLNPDAAPTIIFARGGIPNKADPRNANIFDQMSDAIGSLQAVYVAASRVSGLRRQSSKQFVKGHTPGLVPDRELSAPKDEPSMGQRRAGAIDYEKKSRRQPEVQAPANFQTEFNVIVKKIRPVFPKLIKQAEEAIFLRAKRLLGSDNFDAEEKLLQAKKALRQFKIAVDTTQDLKTTGYDNPIVTMIAGALKQATGINNINSQDGADAIRDFNEAGAVGLGPVLDAIRSKLISIAS